MDDIRNYLGSTNPPLDRPSDGRGVAMRSIRALFVFLFIVFALFTAGCGGTWTYDFTSSEANTDDWITESSIGTYEIEPDKGLSVHYAYFSSPKSFIGDFTMEAEFELDVDFDNNAYAEFSMQDGPYWEPDNYILNFYDNLGLTDNERWLITDVGPTTPNNDASLIVDSKGNLSQLERSGVNTWKLVKKGNLYNIWINGNNVEEFTSTYCDGDQYCLTYYAATTKGTGRIWLRNVKVTYSGRMVDTPDL